MPAAARARGVVAALDRTCRCCSAGCCRRRSAIEARDRAMRRSSRPCSPRSRRRRCGAPNRSSGMPWVIAGPAGIDLARRRRPRRRARRDSRSPRERAPARCQQERGTSGESKRASDIMATSGRSRVTAAEQGSPPLLVVVSAAQSKCAYQPEQRRSPRGRARRGRPRGGCGRRRATRTRAARGDSPAAAPPASAAL